MYTNDIASTWDNTNSPLESEKMNNDNFSQKVN